MTSMYVDNKMKITNTSFNIDFTKAATIMETSFQKSLICNYGLFIHCGDVHFDISINDNTSLIIPNQ